jgi:hypothetical protein
MQQVEHIDAGKLNVKFILKDVRQRNPSLYYFGWINFLAAIACIVLMFIDHRQVAGINTWIKPFKFYISIGVFAWTISWYMVYLSKQAAVKVYSYVVIVTMLIEMVLITLQAARGVKSHFNVTTPMDGLFFSIMGISILTFTLWTLYIFILFARQRSFAIPEGYLWGIRTGLILFIIFALEGGLMASMLRHTVGAEDGGEGFPLLNWSKEFGDLRIAHFFGMHALQLLPFSGYFILKTKTKMIIFSVIYFLLVSFLLLRALRGMPLY